MKRGGKVSLKEYKIIGKIAKRVCSRFQVDDCPNIRSRLAMLVRMDIAAVHIVNPLRLEELLNADDFNFFHDVVGIRDNLNRRTGKLENCFIPRFSV